MFKGLEFEGLNCDKCGNPAYKVKIADREVILCSDCLAQLLKLIDIYLSVKRKGLRNANE